MTKEDIINIISEHALTVRCLPKVVVSSFYYTGNDLALREDEIKREIIIQDYDLEYYKRTPPPLYSNMTPEQRFKIWKHKYPNGRRLLRIEKRVTHGGWWMVKKTADSNSLIRFSFKIDFVAPTLEEALQLYLDSMR